MKTKIEETIEQKLDKAEIAVKKLETKLAKLKEKFNLLMHSAKTEPRDKWYLKYLMRSNAELETQYEGQKDIITKYQEHYAKYTHFYARFEELMQKHEVVSTETVVE